MTTGRINQVTIVGETRAGATPRGRPAHETHVPRPPGRVRKARGWLRRLRTAEPATPPGGWAGRTVPRGSVERSSRTCQRSGNKTTAVRRVSRRQARRASQDTQGTPKSVPQGPPSSHSQATMIRLHTVYGYKLLLSGRAPARSRAPAPRPPPHRGRACTEGTRGNRAESRTQQPPASARLVLLSLIGYYLKPPSLESRAEGPTRRSTPPGRGRREKGRGASPLLPAARLLSFRRSLRPPSPLVVTTKIAARSRCASCGPVRNTRPSTRAPPPGDGG